MRNVTSNICLAFSVCKFDVMTSRLTEGAILTALGGGAGRDVDLLVVARGRDRRRVARVVTLGRHLAGSADNATSSAELERLGQIFNENRHKNERPCSKFDWIA